MNRGRTPLLLIGMFAACASSLALGFFLGRRTAPAEKPIPVNPGEPWVIHAGVEPSGEGLDAVKRADVLEKRLKAAEAEIAQLRRRAAEPGTPGGATLDQLRVQVEPLVKELRGRELLRLMGRFAALGESGFADAFAIWKLLRDAEETGEPDFGVSSNDMEEAIGHGMPEFARWGILNPDLVTAEFRVTAASSLSYSRWADPKELLGMLGREKDDQVAQLLASGMSNTDLTDDLIPGLEAAARAHLGSRDSVHTILREIAYIQSEAADDRLKSLGSDPDPTLRETAALMNIWRHPKGTGVLVGTCAGTPTLVNLRSGDIIVSIGNDAVGTGNRWSEQIELLKKSDGNVIVTCVRDGQTVTSAIPAKELAGVWAFAFVRASE